MSGSSKVQMSAFPYDSKTHWSCGDGHEQTWDDHYGNAGARPVKGH
jgi:hypothetical protein